MKIKMDRHWHNIYFALNNFIAQHFLYINEKQNLNKRNSIIKIYFANTIKIDLTFFQTKRANV